MLRSQLQFKIRDSNSSPYGDFHIIFHAEGGELMAEFNDKDGAVMVIKANGDIMLEEKKIATSKRLANILEVIANR